MRCDPLAAALLLLAGCTTPFSSMGPETGPPEDPQSLGSAIHGWPWLEHAWHGEAERTDVLWPLVSVREAATGFPPKTDSFLPLFVHSSAPAGVRWGLRPLFDIEKRGVGERRVEDVDVLFPLVKWRTEPDASRFEVRPLLFTGRRDDRSWFTLFPLWFHEEDADSSETLLLPAYYRREQGGEVRDLHVWPLWGKHVDGTFRRDWTLFPFFSVARDPATEHFEWNAPFPFVRYASAKDMSSVRVLPFYWREATPDAERFFVFPSWWHGKGGGSEADVLFPLWWDLEKKDRSWRALFPFWMRGTIGEDVVRTHWLWPLVYHEREEDGTATHVFPVLWLDRHGDDRRYTHVWPLYGTSRRGERREVSTVYPFFTYGWDEDSWALDAPFPFVHFGSGPASWRAHVFPLFHVKEEKDASSGSLLLFLAKWNSRVKEGREESEFRVLLKLFERERTPERTKTALNPLFRHETNARGDTHWSVLFGLVAATTEQGSTRWRFLWFL
jgi:hypothetical protein